MGKLIVFESLDGAGKSTQIKLLKQYIESQGYSVFTHHYPQEDKPIGKAIYDCLNNHSPMVHKRPDLFQRLYVADQYNDQPFLLEQLKNHDFVILDRYLYSTIVYGMANNLEFEDIRTWQVGLKLADMLIILHGDAAVCMSRLDRATDAHEKVEFQKVINNLYIEVATYNFEEIYPIALLSCMPSIEDVQKSIQEFFNTSFNQEQKGE